MISFLQLRMIRLNKGFSYLSVMAMIVIIGISLTAVSYQWKTMAKREKEKELLFRGNEIRSAIIQYVYADPLQRFPHTLEDLMKDPRSPNPKRYLRKIYKDPVTGEDFLLITDPARGLVGVRSASSEKPLKTSNFKVVNRCFEGKKKYREWLFMVDMVVGIPAAGLPQPGVGVRANAAGVAPAASDAASVQTAQPLLGLPCPPTDNDAEDMK